MNYLGMNLKNIFIGKCVENYITLMKEIKENKWRCILYSWIERFDISNVLVFLKGIYSFGCGVTQLYLTLCNPMDCSTPSFPVFQHFPELAQSHVHWVGDAIQPSCPLLSPFLPAFNLSQHSLNVIPKSICGYQQIVPKII